VKHFLQRRLIVRWEMQLSTQISLPPDNDRSAESMLDRLNSTMPALLKGKYHNLHYSQYRLLLFLRLQAITLLERFIVCRQLSQEDAKARRWYLIQWISSTVVAQCTKVTFKFNLLSLLKFNRQLTLASTPPTSTRSNDSDSAHHFRLQHTK
jgi:hypothetical protein